MKRKTFLGIVLSIIVLAGVSYANSYNVDVDVKPASCPNPFNLMNRGVLSVAILGSDSFDVAEIDPSTILLEEFVPPLRWSIEDVASPPFVGDVCDCTTAGGDGYLDLVLKFNSREVAAEIPLIEIYLLELQGEKLDGTPISGADCVVPIILND